MASVGSTARGRWGKSHLHAFAGRVGDQLEDVLRLSVAAVEDEDGHVHVGDLVNQRLAFGVGELVGWAMGCAAARQCLQARSQTA